MKSVTIQDLENVGPRGHEEISHHTEIENIGPRGYDEISHHKDLENVDPEDMMKSVTIQNLENIGLRGHDEISESPYRSRKCWSQRT